MGINKRRIDLPAAGWGPLRRREPGCRFRPRAVGSIIAHPQLCCRQTKIAGQPGERCIERGIANPGLMAQDFVGKAVLPHFGQSDRDLIDNANSDASMPQALVLMNSELFESILKPHTQLRLNLAAAKNPDEQLSAIYLTLLSRQPTAAEKAAWAKSGLSSPEDLVFALINTQQFIFVR